MKNITVAKSAGFCFGVKRALDMVYDVSEKRNDKNIFTLGPLIHNEQVMAKLNDMGIKEAKSIDEIPEQSIVIIRSHGVPPEFYEELKRKNLEFIDATCPFVKKIHNIVAENYKNGNSIIIAGDSNHPEVQGINGWCNYSARIISSEEEAGQLSVDKNTCLVAQTTFSCDIWKNIKKNIKKTCNEVLIFDTICSATDERQKEAEELAKKSDCMIVIGGHHSSNTKKLADICKKHCKNTYHIDKLSELPSAVYDIDTLGVTAGASTPEWIIKEVICKMSEEKIKESANELSFAEELERSLITPKTGDVVKGTVIRITPTEVYVDLACKQDGVIPVGELTSNPDVKPADILKIGDEVEAFVFRVSDVEGTIGLSVRKLSAIAGKKIIESAFENNEIITGRVLEAVNGGVIVISNETRIFVPASQASTHYLEDLSVLVGQEVSLRIREINQRRRKIVGSIKAVAAETRKKQLEEFWAGAEIGKEYEGTVKSLTNYGAFVDIGGIDGLVHISELSWGRIKHPSEVLNVGDKVNVYIINIDKDTNKISLGYKNQADNPWNKVKESLRADDVIKVKIVRIVPFGAFAEIYPNVDGLIHISQISNERIDKVANVLNLGDEVEVKVTNIDWDNQKISLSMRALLEPVAPAVEEAAPAEEAVETTEETSAE